MIKRTCDKCEKEIRQDNKFDAVELKGIRYGELFDVDLCGDCYIAFEEWLAGKGNENE